jgi:WD40 repeat protein
MSTVDPEADRRRRLDEAIADYLVAADAGRAPESGTFLARYPDLRDELAQFLADRAGLDRLFAPLRPAPAVAELEPTAADTVGARSPDGGEPTRAGDVTAAGSAEPTVARTPADVATVTADARPGLPDDGLSRGAVVRYFGDYEIRQELGRGGMGVVYRARQVSLNRPVALKMIKAGVLADEADLRRFQNEAEAVALLDHPGIVPVYEVGEHDGQRYFSMKLVEGGNLADRLADYRGDPRAAAGLVAEAAEAVAHAHMRGILHRDLKPANILVDGRGHPHITDFGLAKRVEADVEMTASGAILGTPAYMSPEQAAGRRGTITTATDVYGLGTILYALLTGRGPFSGDSVVDTLTAVREQPPAPPRKFNAKVPRDLEVICLKCLAKDPRRRYANAQALADDLRAWLSARPIAARPVGPVERARLWCRRRPAVAALSALLVVVALAGLVAAGTQWRAAILNAEAARKSERRAIENAEMALKNEQTATRRGEELARSNQQLRQAGYASAMQLAQREWDLGNVARVRRVLDDLRPAADADDLRGFEWHYLRRQCDEAALTLRLPDEETAAPRWINRLEIRPDGGRALVVSAGRVIVWDLPGGRPVTLVSAPGRFVLDARYSPDGTRLATLALVLGDKPVPESRYPSHLPALFEVRDSAGGEPLASAELPITDDGSLAFRPDGRQVAVRLSHFEGRTIDTGHERVLVVDVGSGRVAWTADGKPINDALAFSPDGKWLVGPADGRTLNVWDAGDGKVARTIDTRETIVRDAAFHPDGSRLAVAGDSGRVTVWSVPGWEIVQSLQVTEQHASRCRFSPDGKALAGQGAGVIKVWDGATGIPLFTIRGANSELAFTPDGGRIAAVGDEDAVWFWDAKPGQGALVHKEKQSLYHARFAPDGRRVLDDEGTVLDVATGAVMRTIPRPEEGAMSATFLPDGRRAILARYQWDPKTGRPTPADLVLWDLEAGREVQHRTVSPAPFGLDVSPDGRWLLSLSTREDDETYSQKELVVRDAATWEPVLTRSDPPVYGRYAVFARDSRTILAGTKGGVALIEVPSGRVRATYGPCDGSPLAVAISPDGRRVAAAGKGKTGSVVHVWDAESAVKRHAIPQTATEDVVALAFSPDGRRLASAGFDAKVKLWDAESGLELLTLSGHTSWIWEVWFSPDGRRIVSCSRDRTVRIWDAGALMTESSGPPESDAGRRSQRGASPAAHNPP